VSINGNDANPCSATQPCRSFNQALTVVEPGGEIVVQNSGGYSTGFTISQSVTIDAAGYNASVISLDNTDLCTISAGTGDRVVLRGISFHGASVGLSAINVAQVGSLYLEKCSIAEFTGDGVQMLHGGKLFVTGTDMRACVNSGIDLGTDGGTPARLVGHDSRFTECGNGIFSGNSNSATVSSSGLVSDCTASLCTGSGFSVSNTNTLSAGLTLTNCRAFGNSIGLETNATSGIALIEIVNCVLRQPTDIQSTGNPNASAVIGTSPGSNLTNTLPFGNNSLR
jgi:hypothetical protein